MSDPNAGIFDGPSLVDPALMPPPNTAPLKLADDRVPVDDILARFGRRGGPSRYGWHTHHAGYACHREAEFSRLMPRKLVGLALAVGSVNHELLAERYATIMEGAPIERVRAKADGLFEALIAEGWGQVVQEVRPLWLAYISKYGEKGERDPYVQYHRIVAVEKELIAELPWGVRFSARADLILAAADGLVIVDHKTVTRKDQSWYDGWAVDPQMQGLVWITQHTRIDKKRKVVGYSINGLDRVKEPELPRRFFAANPTMVRDWLSMMRYRHVEQQVSELAGHPPNLTACIRRYGACAWINECVRGVTPAQAARQARRREKRPE